MYTPSRMRQAEALVGSVGTARNPRRRSGRRRSIMSSSASPDSIDVSVLVPVLDEAAHIRATAAVMLAQELDGSFEVLFVDGGSRDGTREVLEQLSDADARVRLIDNPARQIPSALNLGLRAARGEYVARMDAHT